MPDKPGVTDYSGLLADLHRALAAGVCILARPLDGEADAVVDYERGSIHIDPALPPGDMLRTLGEALSALPVSRASYWVVMAAGGETAAPPSLVWPPLRAVE